MTDEKRKFYLSRYSQGRIRTGKSLVEGYQRKVIMKSSSQPKIMMVLKEKHDSE
jgi:hypothetical protein